MEKCTRRQFFKGSALVGSGALLGTELLSRASGPFLAKAGAAGNGSNPLLLSENTLYTTCLQCHINCDLKVRISEGLVVKVDGNPLSPQNLLPNLPTESTSPDEAARVDGKVCPRGQAGIQTLYDPYRLTTVLKRTGPRGSNTWKTIAFDQAIDEIVQGGALFAEAGEDRVVPGLRDIYALNDAAVAKAMEADVKALASGELSVADFKLIHAEHLDVLIDPDHPDLGPKNNGFVFMAGRIEHGRLDFAKRVVNAGFGSVNLIEHTTICEQSHHIAYAQLTNQSTVEGGKIKFEKGKTHLKPDLLNSEFVIFFGTGAFEANFGVTPMAEKITHSVLTRGFRYAVVDPRLSKTAGKADYWVPIKPGADGALAMAMVRWIIENERYDAAFLRNATKGAAQAAGETSWSGAGYLVEIKDGLPAGYLRAATVGIGGEDQLVVMSSGMPTAVTPDDEEHAVVSDLDVASHIGGLEVKSAFRLLDESARGKTLEEYAEIAGVEVSVVETLATEFTSHGKKAAAELYRGAVQHTNGFYSAIAIISLNALIGNVDWAGGISAGGGHWHEIGDKEGQAYPLGTLHPAAIKAFGVPITREKWAYEKSTLFERDGGYPAKRPWYPFTSNVYQEVLPSAADGYPYDVKVLFVHMGTPLYSAPAGHMGVDIIKDVEKIPLVVSCDIVLGETTSYADYVIPDITFFERWGFTHPVPDVQSKVSHVRQPVAAPLTDIVEVGGESMPISLDAALLAIAEKLGLSGVGGDGFGSGLPLVRPEDYYLKMAANIAMGDKPGDTVPEASAEEITLFQSARRHLPAAAYDWDRWQKALRPEEWSRVVYILNRGGRFDPFEHSYDGPRLGHPLAGLVHLYAEGPAQGKNSMTGEPFGGVPTYREVQSANSRPMLGNEGEFKLITFKEVFHTQSRTMGNYWSLPLRPENAVLMNPVDAEARGFAEGDQVRLSSASNPEGSVKLEGRTVPVVGGIQIKQGIRPGVVAVSHHFGHWGYGAVTAVVDGQEIVGDERRGRGVSPNPVMLLDPDVSNVCLTDPVGGSASFMDSWVRLERV